jgi:hypothetical protein
MTTTAADFRNPPLIRKLGIAALVKELGAVGTAYFLRQFSAGAGDYTAERDRWLADAGVDDILAEVHAIEWKHPHSGS